jgi:hypothetical protein
VTTIVAAWHAAASHRKATSLEARIDGSGLMTRVPA